MDHLQAMILFLRGMSLDYFINMLFFHFDFSFSPFICNVRIYTKQIVTFLFRLRQQLSSRKHDRFDRKNHF